MPERAVVLTALRREAMYGFPKPPPLFRVRQSAIGSGSGGATFTLPWMPLRGSILMFVGSQPTQTGGFAVVLPGVAQAHNGWNASTSGNQLVSILHWGHITGAPAQSVAATWNGQGCAMLVELQGLDGVHLDNSGGGSVNTVTVPANWVPNAFGILLAVGGARSGFTAVPTGYRVIRSVSNGSGSKVWLGWRYCTQRALDAVTFTSSGTTGIHGYRGLWR
jgi:hypothetical protein